jgi:hypothetical protein
VDPLAGKYPSLSSYNYCANNPLIYIDPDGRVLELIFNNPTERARHMNVAVSMNTFVNHTKGKSVNMVTHEMSRGATESFSAGGPVLRYVVDPTNSKQVIDMRHFFAVGQSGEIIGLLIEVIQSIPAIGDPSSAFDAQDFYSNYLGSEFFSNFYDKKSSLSLSEQLNLFFEKLQKEAEKERKEEERRKKKEEEERKREEKG